MEFSLREVSVNEEFLQVLPLLRQLVEEENNSFTKIPAIEESLAAWKKAAAYGYRLYAAWDKNSALLAVLGLTEIYDPLDSRPSFRINNFIVDSTVRGQGLGHRIMDAIEVLARKAQASMILLEVLPDNEKAIRFYTEQLGYHYACNRMIKDLR